MTTPQVTSFASVQDMLNFFSTNSGQIAAAEIPQSPAILLSLGGRSVPIPNVGMALLLKNSQSILLDKRAAEIVLNDGILTRQAIPIRFM